MHPKVAFVGTIQNGEHLIETEVGNNRQFESFSYCQ